MSSHIMKCDLCDGKGHREIYVETKCGAWWNSCSGGKIYYIEGRPGNCYVCKGTGKGKPKLQTIACVKCNGKGYTLKNVTSQMVSFWLQEMYNQCT